MKISNIAEQKAWNCFIAGNCPAEFLESWEWGEFQKEAGSKVIRLSAENDKGAAACATFIKKKLFLGKSYFYCPRGPVSCGNKEADGLLFHEIKKIAEKEKAIFLRFEPSGNLKAEGLGVPVLRTIDVQPSKTLILDLSKSEENMLGEMHQKTRYNIRLAEKKGVKVKELGMENFEDFWKLMNETRDRDGFRLHGRNYYSKMLECAGCGGAGLKKNEMAVKMFAAEYQGKIISVNLIGFFGDTVTYMHGASSDEYRNVMAPYLLQWHLIKLAKNLGYKYYDFYGIDEKKWPGVTRFKKGFGGKEVSYPGTFDLIFDKAWYNCYIIFRKLRRLA
ncbi:MAG: peptidoglycan bridge formation glycyltransferase FemA/FemB family protein [Patescibacteria group bacterium]|jgi:lipid II:glycine glycyltransferase (peptidoglycan interpeptide bridge formation enzyme)